MKKALRYLMVVLTLKASCLSLGAQNRTYTTPEEVAAAVEKLAKEHPAVVKLHPLATSVGGFSNYLVEVKGTQAATRPAVLVVANPEGITPQGTEAALWLLRDLVKNPQRLDSLAWFVVPCLNPDAANRFFTRPAYADGRNLRPFNDDMDEATDEDGFEDLNGDGWITQMRVKDPDGTMIPDSTDARLLRRADPSKGEKGIYKLYSEGIDNDLDGSFNEDGTGGTNLAIQFPHLFPHDGPASGIFPGYEPEIHALFKFVFDHPEIAMTMTYGSTNFCLASPRTNRKGSVSLSAIKLPARTARMLNADPEKTYSLDEVKEMMKAIVPPGTTVDDNMVASMLDQGAVVNPLADDLKLYKHFNDAFNTYLKENKSDSKRAAPSPDKDGSFELWAYYHLGLMSWSMDFWGIQDKAESSEQKAEGKGQMAKGKEEVGGEKSKVPLTSEQKFLWYSDSVLGGKGFVVWKAFQHPELGEVEIGGEVPFARTVPPAAIVDSLLKVQVPWIYELASHLPKLKFASHKVEDLGGGVFMITTWIRNESKLPYPIAMGKRNRTPVPAQLTLKGKNIEFLSGREYQPLSGIDAYGQTRIEWMIRMDKPGPITLEINAPNAYGDLLTINSGGN